MSRILDPTSPDSPPVDLGAIRTVHVLAVAGTGMGAFACLLKEAGYEVRGSDQAVWPPMSEVLSAAGIPWREGFSAENLEPPPDLVVVGNVVRRANPEADAMRARRLPHLSFPEALGALFLDTRHPIVVAGTHGKTTTTALVTWLLRTAGLDPSFLVGGVPKNLGRPSQLGRGQHFVVEGDEYDTAYFDKRPKFLHYRPQTAILTSLEFDHADIYADIEAYTAAFERFVALVPPSGRLLACAGSAAVHQVAAACPGRVETYSARTEAADWAARDLTTGPEGSHFELIHRGRPLGRLHLATGGRHNVENAVAAVAVALEAGASWDAVREGLSTFEGVRRRQELRGSPGEVTVIEDFAHHPTAVEATLGALRRRFPGRRLWAVYEPRSNTARRRIYQHRYEEAFDAADCVVVASPPPHPDPIPEAERFDPPALAEALERRGKHAYHRPTPEAVHDLLAGALRPGDVVVVMSNGSFGGLIERLLQTLESR
ncbi:MAG: UDP-N-acetylmuramate:L-alanyl-gamma-D-glutamyl-meso-diaminopimelate ligase [Deltaproteobacteria bacterium]|nr:MAG: UDP-N-acetylmuramate:L-alanyl-gamma-D-glutamyl-meso-diaminopimelate ligase [Deltaproteobacteria bacterium]